MAGGCLSRVRRIMTQGLPQSLYAVTMGRGTEHHLGEIALGHVPAQMREQLPDTHRFAADDLFQQGVVTVGQGIHQRVMGCMLISLDPRRHRDHLGRLTLTVAVCAFRNEVDIPGHHALLQNGQLAGHQLGGRLRLQGGDEFDGGDSQGIDLVDEQDERCPSCPQCREGRAQRHGAGWIGVGHHHRYVSNRQRRGGLRLELDRAWAVEQRPAITQKTAVYNPGFGARFGGAGGAGVTQPGAGQLQKRFA
jgi:hypothetical protein